MILILVTGTVTFSALREYFLKLILSPGHERNYKGLCQNELLAIVLKYADLHDCEVR